MTTALRVHGADISHHQSGRLDLQRARKQGLQWLYHKATEGSNFTDPNYERRRAECQKIGLPFGAYHFARPEKGDATTEANRFLDVARPVVGNLLPALDLEVHDGMTDSELQAWAKTWVTVVSRAIGAHPVVYSPYDLGGAVKGCLRWRPRYNNDNRQPILPWDIWQFSNGIYGVPNSLLGLGHVDLNTMRPGLTVDDMLLKRKKDPAPEPKDTVLLVTAHVSMQHDDSERQVREDLAKIFARAKRRGIRWVTGTEAGQRPVRPAVREAAQHVGYFCFIAGDVWIAVKTASALASSFKIAVRPDEGVGHHHNLGILSASWTDPDVGRINAGVTHFATKGAKPGDPNYAANGKIVEAIAAWGRQAGAGRALAFVSGDGNTNDRLYDIFRGHPFTTAADELGIHPNTGHGPIDFTASYNRDGRVSAEFYRVLTDKTFPLHTDHFYTETGYQVVK